MVSTTSNTLSRGCNDKNCRQYTYLAALNGHLECLKYAHDSLGVSCAWDPKTTHYAAIGGYLECLQYAHENGCMWHPETTWIAAGYGRLECLKYIYEKCGDVVTWETAKLEDETGVVSEEFPKEIRDFIDSVREDWKCGLNRPGTRTKSAKRNR